MITYILAFFAVSVICISETLYKKVDFPRHTWNMLSTTTITTMDGIKQCGIICSLKGVECNIFKFEKIGNICTYGHVRSYYR